MAGGCYRERIGWRPPLLTITLSLAMGGTPHVMQDATEKAWNPHTVGLPRTTQLAGGRRDRETDSVSSTHHIHVWETPQHGHEVFLKSDPRKVAHVHGGTVLRHEKEGRLETCHPKDEPGKHDGQGQKTDTWGHVLHDPTATKCPE